MSSPKQVRLPHRLSEKPNSDNETHHKMLPNYTDLVVDVLMRKRKHEHYSACDEAPYEFRFKNERTRKRVNYNTADN